MAALSSSPGTACRLPSPGRSAKTWGLQGMFLSRLSENLALGPRVLEKGCGTRGVTPQTEGGSLPCPWQYGSLLSMVESQAVLAGSLVCWASGPPDNARKGSPCPGVMVSAGRDHLGCSLGEAGLLTLKLLAPLQGERRREACGPAVPLLWPGSGQGSPACGQASFFSEPHAGFPGAHSNAGGPARPRAGQDLPKASRG